VGVKNGNGDVRFGFELQVALTRVVAVVIFKGSLDVHRVRSALVTEASCGIKRLVLWAFTLITGATIPV
jgi:hypothetical protein